MATPLRLIGYWRNDLHPEYPDPADFVDPSWDEDERHQVWNYLLGGTFGPAYMGYSTCRICGELNGVAEYNDDTFAWPEGLAHYVNEHGVRLPKDFVDHALRRLQAFEERGRDTSWWLRMTGISAATPPVAGGVGPAPRCSWRYPQQPIGCRPTP